MFATLDQACMEGAKPPDWEGPFAEGDPAVTLLEAAERADLLVVGGRGDGPFAGLFLGPVGHHCVTQAPCPVVVVPHYR